MDPLVYLFTRSFANGVKRSLTSPRRTISLVVFALYYYWLIMRPFMPDQPMPTMHQLPIALSLPSRPILDGAVFAVMAVASLFMLTGTLTYRGGFRPADVDVLFATPVSPRRVLFFRIIRDYLLTLLVPLLFGILGYRGTKLGIQSLFANYPAHGADILRMTWLAWMLMALGWVAVGYGASLFVGRSDLQSDTNRKVITGGIIIVVAITAAYVGINLHEELSWDSALTISHSLLLRVMLAPATAATATALGGIEGDWAVMTAGIAGSILIIVAGFLAALSQVGWLYDQAAARGFDAINLRKLRRGGNQYALMAEQARRGKLRRHWVSEQISLRTYRGGRALMWKELLLQSRGSFGTGLTLGVLTIGSLIGIAWLGISMKPDNAGLMVVSSLCGFSYFFSLTVGFGGFQEMLRRMDLLKPLPFSSGKTLFWELVGKAPMPGIMLALSGIAAACVNPLTASDCVAGVILSFFLLIEIMGAVLFTVVLFPDYDDPTQRGLSMIFMLLAILIGSSPGVGIYFVMTLVAHIEPVVAALPASAVLLAVTAGMTTIAGSLYSGYNPTE